MDLTIKRKYNTNMLTHSILNNPNNPLLAPCIFNGSVPTPTTQNSPNTMSNSANTNSVNANVAAQVASTSMPTSLHNTTGGSSSLPTQTVIHDQLIQEELIKQLQEKYNQQIYLQELVRQRYEDFMNPNILLQSQLMYPQYNYSQFTHLRSSATLPTNSNIKSATTRSPSHSPSSSSSPVDDKIKHDDDKQQQQADADDMVPFPRYNSIDNISKKLNNIARIECHQNDENNNPALKSSSSSSSVMRSLSNEKLLPHSQQQQSKFNPAFMLQQQQLYGNNNNNNKECNNNNKLANGGDIIKPALSSSSLANNSNSSSSSNGSNNNINTVTSNNNNNNNNSVFVPPCTSNGISLEIREKLRQNILKRQDKNNVSPNGSNSNLNGSNSNLNANMNNKANNNSINNYLLTHQLYDDSVLPRSISEPNFIPNKIKSVLKDNIKKRMNPLSNTKRPQVSTPNGRNSPKSNSTMMKDEIPAPVLAAVPSLKLNKEIEASNSAAFATMAASLSAAGGGILPPPNHQQYPFNTLFNRSNLQSLFLNQSQPYLNNLQWQALATAAVLENANAMPAHHSAKDSHHNHHHHHHITSLSMSSLPNPNQQLQAKRQRTTPAPSVAAPSSSTSSRTQFIPQFGNIAHVEEESEMLLANELRDASKADEEMHNAFMYGHDDDDEDDDSYDDLDSRPRGFPSYNAAIHRHPKHLLKKISCYSDPYLMRSNLLNQQLHGGNNSSSSSNNNNNTGSSSEEINASNESLSQARGSNSRLNDRRNTLSAENAMEFATSERATYKYTTGIVYDSRMLKHECTCRNPKNHIETPARLEAIWERFEARGVLDECEIIKAKMASIEDISICHSESYASVFGADISLRSKLTPEYLQEYLMSICMAPCNGLALVSDQDNSWNEEHTPIACRVAIGSTYELSDLVVQGKLKNGFALVRPPGSHAEYNKPLGFCYFNNVAIAAKLLKKNLNLERILIVDWDVHHGNGTQQLTYDDPNILYISLHRHDNGKFFPGSGSIDECGIKNGLGYNVNIAWSGKLEPPMSDAEYLAAFRCVVMPIAKAFKPQLVLVSSGFDGTENHPKELGGYKLTPMLFAYMTKKLMSLAEGKVVLVLEGGYDLPSLCDCSEMCVNALMNKQIPSFPNETLDAIPNKPAIQTLEQVIEVQKRYWPTLKENSKYITMSQNQFIRIDTAE